MQISVVYEKEIRKMLASFEINTLITSANILLVSGITYLITTKRDIVYTAPNEIVYVKNN